MTTRWRNFLGLKMTEPNKLQRSRSVIQCFASRVTFLSRHAERFIRRAENIIFLALNHQQCTHDRWRNFTGFRNWKNPFNCPDLCCSSNSMLCLSGIFHFNQGFDKRASSRIFLVLKHQQQFMKKFSPRKIWKNPFCCMDLRC